MRHTPGDAYLATGLRHATTISLPNFIGEEREKTRQHYPLSAVFFILSKQNYQVGRDSGPQFRLNARGSFKPDNGLMAKEEAVRIPASARLRRGIRSLGGQARGPCATVE